MVKSELEMEREDVAIDSYYGDGRRVSIAPKLNSRTQSAQSKEEIIEEPAVVIFTNSSKGMLRSIAISSATYLT